MKAAVLHSGADWAVEEFGRSFEKQGIESLLIPVCEIEVDRARRMPAIENLVKGGVDIWVNRVYPSSGDLDSIGKVIGILEMLESRGITTVNPSLACRVDYDKLLSFNVLAEAGVPTPYTEKVPEDLGSALGIAYDLGFPCVVKRRTGGQGKGVSLLESAEDAERELYDVINKRNGYRGEYVLQEFCRSAEDVDFDVRMGVVMGDACMAHKRSLVSPGGGAYAWMGSCSHGSDITRYDLPRQDEKDVALKATEAIGAVVNICDVVITDRGPVVIECNPTPGFIPGAERWIDMIVGKVLENQSYRQELVLAARIY